MFSIYFSFFLSVFNSSDEAIITASGVFNSCDASAIKSFCLSNASFAGLVILIVNAFEIK